MFFKINIFGKFPEAEHYFADKDPISHLKNPDSSKLYIFRAIGGLCPPLPTVTQGMEEKPQGAAEDIDI